MVQYYSVFGARVGSHYLAMGVLGALFGGTTLALRGGGKKTTQTPPINAASSDEADFIKYFGPPFFFSSVAGDIRQEQRLTLFRRKFMEQAEADEKAKTNH